MNKVIYIYCLLDPFDGRCRYVGVSNDPNRRLKRHFKYEDRNPYKFRWINKILKQDSYPILKILETVNKDSWGNRERWWIRFFRKKEQPLTNLTKGGEGTFGLKCPEEKKKKISESLMGHKVSEETKKRQSKVAKDRLKDSKNHSMFGKTMTLGQRKKLSESHKGYVMPEIQKRKISESLKENHPFRKYEITIEKIKDLVEQIGPKRNAIARELGVSYRVVTNRIQEFGYKNWKSFVEGNAR